MKALFVGGSGKISTAVVKRLVEELNWEVWILNRGNRNHVLPEGVHQIIADINDEADVADKIKDLTFDSNQGGELISTGDPAFQINQSGVTVTLQNVKIAGSSKGVQIAKDCTNVELNIYGGSINEIPYFT